jgi:hypothetical protein
MIYYEINELQGKRNKIFATIIAIYRMVHKCGILKRKQKFIGIGKDFLRQSARISGKDKTLKHVI